MAKGSKSHQYNTWWIKTPAKTEEKNRSFSDDFQHFMYNTTLHCYRWLVNANISNWETYVAHFGALFFVKSIKEFIYETKKSLQLFVDSRTYSRSRWNMVCAGTCLLHVFNESNGYHFVRYVISHQ